MATKKATEVNEMNEPVMEPETLMAAGEAKTLARYVITHGTDHIGCSLDEEKAFTVARALATGWGEHISVRKYSFAEPDLPVKWSDISPVGNVTVIYDFETEKERVSTP